MKPQDDQQPAQVAMPRLNHTRYNRSVATPPPRDHTSSHRAASDVVRGQLESIYSNDPVHTQRTSPHTTAPVSPHTTVPVSQSSQVAQSQNPVEVQSPQPANQTSSHGLRTAPPEVANQQNASNLSPYQRTMEAGLNNQQQQVDKQWQQYHSAWQQYYQQYYHRYYLSSIYKQSQTESSQSISINSDQPSPEVVENATVSQNDAMQELRDTIRHKISSSTDKVKKSRHFIPAIAGIAVLLLFILLQYNRVIVGSVAAYVSPGNIDPQNIIVDPSSTVEVGPEPKMIIPKINIDAPVVYGVGPDHDSQMTAMEDGIAHFAIPGANAVPGQVGNTVMAAHSSNDVFARGDYKFVFAQNEKLVQGDIIYMNYEGVRYTYSVTSTEVVLPSEVSKVQLATDKPMLTLVSCVPLGTAQKRLLVYAEQVSPDPNGASSASESETDPEASSNIPGKPSPTLLERIFGAT